MAGNPDIPWDIYIDEIKENPRAIGFLAVPNTASFSQKLYRCRQHPPTADGKTMETREIHFNAMHRTLVPTALDWISTTFKHKHAKFFMLPWPKTDTKEVVALRMLRVFCRKRRLEPPYNVVAIFDYDSTHARTYLQNVVRNSGQISRCYHLDSSKNDSLQCCDLFLGATWRLKNDPSIHMLYPELKERYDRWRQTSDPADRLKNADAKRLVAGFLADRMASGNKTVYDFTKADPNSGR